MAPRGKKTTFTPAFTGRRSRTEREALEKAGKERDQARRDAIAREDRAVKKERMLDPQNRRGGQRSGQTRGGYSGVSIGPFSMGSASQDRRKNAGASSSGSRATRVKRENGDFGGGSSRGTGTKREDESASSDDEDGDMPRKNIDFIELSSDEDESGPGQRKDRPLRSHASATLPVRIARREHQDRIIGINTDASSATSGKAPQDGHSSSTAIKVESSDGTSRKGKGKAKDIEITDVRRPYKGVWQEEDASQVSVKMEPMSEDEDAVPVGNLDSAMQAKVKSRTASPEMKKKPKFRRKSLAQPALQTEQDKAEWGRFLDDRLAIRVELGPSMSKDESPKDAVTETVKADDNLEKSKNNVRSNKVYLFQLPPTMPDLLAPEIKDEPKVAKVDVQTPSLLAPTSTAPQTPIKMEDGPPKQIQESHGPRLVPGRVGKIRVHESGVTKFIWGGTNFELIPGQPLTYLQETTSVNIVPQAERVAPEDGGDVYSFGQIKGKFIVVPDWSALL